MAFHWQDGWFFERTPDGSVSIYHLAVEEQVADTAFTVPAAEWASIIASVSLLGETSEQYEAAREFHGVGVKLCVGVDTVTGTASGPSCCTHKQTYQQPCKSLAIKGSDMCLRHLEAFALGQTPDSSFDLQTELTIEALTTKALLEPAAIAARLTHAVPFDENENAVAAPTSDKKNDTST